jgi:hypothetical protein
MIGEGIQHQHAGAAVEPSTAGAPEGHLAPDMANASEIRSHGKDLDGFHQAVALKALKGRTQADEEYVSLNKFWK